MQFVKTADLKRGMRLARPIYNKNGVLLYERNSKLTDNGIASIKNFGLIGIFILEPAEPVPPMTVDDINFERFQTMYVFALKEELQTIINLRRAPKIQTIVGNIVKNYGHLDKKINFIQNLRSIEDHVYKHSLNVAMLCAMMSHMLNVRLDEQQDTLIAAAVHDIGKLMLPKNLFEKNELTEQEMEMLRHSEYNGHEVIEKVFSSNPSVKRICVQCRKALDEFEMGKIMDAKLLTGTKILMVAETYDTMTAIQYGKEPVSEVAAIKYLLENPEIFDERVVSALISSINILSPGTSIELNTGDKGVVLAQRGPDILRPMVLVFRDNAIIDLSNEFLYGDMEIVDIMKTMDNRHIMDTSILKSQGISFDEPEYVEVPDEEVYVPGRDF